MGDETAQFATRFSLSVELLSRLSTDAGLAALRKQRGKALERVVLEALDSIAAVHETGTDAVKRWAEHCAAVLAQVRVLRDAVAHRGLDPEVQREARALVELVSRSDAAR